ncbi:FecR family protein [Novosphingobium sp. PhB165]|uniref:FecR family protein n=1 Tax=Novosphingobium sp. PhB165 TaxID=2485105 RepID=UPI0010EFCE86|nr:FecR domain-containing protein [Novosphingobium sp. PhB165]TCM17065.1 FecR family protein [Novosphingobium sp. PhB165]
MNRDIDPILSERALPDDILSEAARWHLASDDDAMDWDAFTLWLEHDPRHRRAFDEVALTDALLTEHRPEIRAALAEQGDSDHAANDAEDEAEALAAGGGRAPVRPLLHRRVWQWAGMAVAASLAAAIAVPQFMDTASEVYATEGAPERIALADGSTILLAPRSKLTVDGRGQDHIGLTGGAWFDIRHDPDRQLQITAGDVSINDIGTRFDVQAQDDAVRVAVVEGQVQVSAQAMAGPVQVPAGKGLAFDSRAGTATVAAVNTQDVGSWKDGRLTYDNARLVLVASDLHRYAGITVDVPPALRDRRFSGTLIVDNGDAALRDLVQLMGLRLSGHAGAWRLEQP